jgi:hypothetical protein
MEESAKQQRWWTRLADRSERFAIRLSDRPYAAMAWVLVLNASLAAVFILAGEVIFDDPAEFFRELQPGTWLSFAELLFVASVASAIYRLGGGSGRAGLGDFWGLSAAIFAIFAFLEITQITQFLGKGLDSLEASAPFGFRDIDAFVLSLLFVAAAVGMLRYIRDLFAHPPAMAVLAVGVLLGAASQTLDSALKSTSGEFVAEECFKLAAEVFLIGGYLIVLHRVRRTGAHQTGIGTSPQEPV